MIPASSISAALSSELVYNPSIHVQTVEIDRTGNTLLTEATTNYVRWYLDKSDFADMLRIVPGRVDVSNQIFTMDASSGRDITDASECVIQFSRITKTFTIPLHNPSINYGLDIDLDNSSNIGYVGNIPVQYDREMYTSDLSNATASSTTTTWGFAQSSIEMVINWEVSDLSNAITVTATAGNNLIVQKPYNEAAVDFIQIRLNNEAYGAHGRTTTSSDILSASVDFASHFQAMTGGTIQFSTDTPTLTISDLTLTRSLQQAINRDTISRRVSTTAELRDVVMQMIELRELTGFQSVTGLGSLFPTTIAGQSQSTHDMSLNVIPMIYFRYRPPTQFAIADVDPFNTFAPHTTNYLYVSPLDANNIHGDVENIERGVVTASIKLNDGTDVSASSYEIVPINYTHTPYHDASYNDVSYNTYVYKLNFSGQPFYLHNNTDISRNNDLSFVTVNGTAFRVGREKTPSLTESLTDISRVYRIQNALTHSVDISKIDLSSVSLSANTGSSGGGILAFSGGYDLRISDQYLNATPGDNRICLCKTTGGNEIIDSIAVGITTVSGLSHFTAVNNDASGTFDVWIDGVRQWNLNSNTDVTYKSDLGGLTRLGTTYSDISADISMQDLRTFNTALTPDEAENPAEHPKPTIEWSMCTQTAEIGTLTLSGDISFNFAASIPTSAKVPLIVHQSALPTQKYTRGDSIATRTYTFDRPLLHFALDASFISTDTSHSGIPTYDKTRKSATFSFPVENSSGYAFRNLSLRNLGTHQITAMNDASYGFDISSSLIWNAPTGVSGDLIPQTSVPATYTLIKDTPVLLRMSLAGGDALHSSTPANIIDKMQVAVDTSLTLIDISNVNAENRTLDFEYTATSTSNHVFELTLKKPDGNSYTKNTYKITVPTNKIFV